jgi:hypothetical protein
MTDKEHPDYGKLVDALAKMKDIAGYLNASKVRPDGVVKCLTCAMSCNSRRPNSARASSSSTRSCSIGHW